VLRGMVLALGAEGTEISELPDRGSLILRVHVGGRSGVVIVGGGELARLVTDQETESRVRERVRAILAALDDR
jgi:hypothetical protein